MNYTTLRYRMQIDARGLRWVLFAAIVALAYNANVHGWLERGYDETEIGHLGIA